jgi:hypothetical protein
MELSPSWKAANCAVTQELPSILWNPKVHYRVHKSPPLASVLSQIDSVSIPLHPISSKIHFNILWYFSCGFPTNILYAFLFSPSCYMPCPSHPACLTYKIKSSISVFSSLLTLYHADDYLTSLLINYLANGFPFITFRQPCRNHLIQWFVYSSVCNLDIRRRGNVSNSHGNCLLNTSRWMTATKQVGSHCWLRNPGNASSQPLPRKWSNASQYVCFWNWSIYFY